MSNIFRKFTAFVSSHNPLRRQHPLESYWENRYRNGGISGSGSYGTLGEFKARIVNQLIQEHNIDSVIDWGCGDGNIVSKIRAIDYLGVEISHTAISICKKRCLGDQHKNFIHLAQALNPKAELTLSLDVLQFQNTNEIYKKHLEDLFTSSAKWVIIYAPNQQERYSDFVVCRNFVKDIESYYPNFQLYRHIPNEYPYSPENPKQTSHSEFFIFKKLFEQ